MSSRKNSREAILDAAEAVVITNGAARLTLDAVAVGAKVSKGGLLYHFGTKEELLLAMLERLRTTFRNAREDKAARLPESPGRGLKALILSDDTFQGHKIKRVCAALLAAGAHNPAILSPIQETRKELIAELTSAGFPTVFATVVVFAMEGLWLMELLGASLMPIDERHCVIEELLRLVEKEEARIGADSLRDALIPSPGLPATQERK